MAFLDDVMVEQINVQAREIQFRRTLLTAIAGVLFGVGWATARTFGIVWLVLAWSAVAIKVGWIEGRKQTPRRR